jgi:hypothetical protein
MEETMDNQDAVTGQCNSGIGWIDKEQMIFRTLGEFRTSSESIEVDEGLCGQNQIQHPSEPEPSLLRFP